MSNIDFTNVVWSPYIKQIEGDTYDASATYFRDNGHYGLVPYTFNNLTWDIDISNGIVYKLNSSIAQEDID